MIMSSIRIQIIPKHIFVYKTNWEKSWTRCEKQQKKYGNSRIFPVIYVCSVRFYFSSISIFNSNSTKKMFSNKFCIMDFIFCGGWNWVSQTFQCENQITMFPEVSYVFSCCSSESPNILILDFGLIKTIHAWGMVWGM